MKTLHEFEVLKETEVEKSEKSVNDKGEEITISKKVKEQIPVKIFIKKPTRALFDDGDLFYSVTISKGITEGLITRALLTKRISNDGGLLSEPDKDLYIKLYNELYEKTLEIQRVSALKEANEENRKKSEVLIGEIAVIRNRLQAFEASQSSLFEHTAEARARNKTIMWWVLQLAYMQDGEKQPAIFAGDNHQEKVKSYEAIEENDEPFYRKVIEKLVLFVTLWYSGAASQKEDFERLEKELA